MGLSMIRLNEVTSPPSQKKRMVDVSVGALRTFRNKVARAEGIKEGDVLEVAAATDASLKRVLSSSRTKTEIDALVVCLQFLANVSVSGLEQRAFCWTVFYPYLILSVPLVRNAEVLEPLSYALWNFAKDGTYCLADEGTTIFKRLVDFYGEEQNGVVTTSFSLLFGRLVERHPGQMLTSSANLSAIRNLDIECVQAESISRILKSLCNAVKEDDTHEMLQGLKNCALARKADEVMLTDLTHWVMKRLSDVSTADRCTRVGHKTDLIALLANLVCQRESIQDTILEERGLELVLNCTRLDDMNPYVREWALLFVRNMCMENVRAQDFIRKLELKEVVTDETLGTDVVFDKLRGKISVRKR